MSKKITYHCDQCGQELDIEFPDDDNYEFKDAGWTHDRHTTDTHYCNKCSEKIED